MAERLTDLGRLKQQSHLAVLKARADQKRLYGELGPMERNGSRPAPPRKESRMTKSELLELRARLTEFGMPNAVCDRDISEAPD